MMKSKYLKILSSQIVVGSMYLTIGGFIVNIGNYFFNLLMGRLLSVADYGSLISLVYLTVIVSLPSTMLRTIITKFTAHYSAKKKPGVITKILKKMSFYSIISALLILAMFILFSNQISIYLNLHDKKLIILSGGIVALSLISSINIGILQGLLRFIFITLLGVVIVSIKILFGWLFVSQGALVYGALLAILLSATIGWIVSYIPLLKYFKYVSDKTIGLRREMMLFSLPTFSQTAALTLFLSSDLIMVKHYFSAEVAGLYAAVSMIGKAIFYALFPIAIVLFPVVAQRFAERKKYLRELFLSIGLIIIGGVVALSIFIKFPDFIVYLFFPGGKYNEAINIIALYGAYMVLLNIAMLLVKFFLVVEPKIIPHVSLIFAVFQLVLIYFFHDSLFRVIYMSIISVGILLMVSVSRLGFLLWSKKREN